MIKDVQVVKLRQLLGEGQPLYLAALKAGMDTGPALTPGRLGNLG
jgi:hypothetical protein